MRSVLLLAIGTLLGVSISEAAKPPRSHEDILKHAKRLEFHYLDRDWICFRAEDVPESLR